MFKTIRNQIKRFNDAVELLVTGRGQTLNKVIEESDTQDKLEIEQANAVIVNHQYLKHMAEARIAARASWRKLQEAAAHDNVTPLIASETRSRKL